MRKRSLILLTMAMVAILLFAFSSAVSASQDNAGAITCKLDINYTGAFWFGTVSGPKCSVTGDIRFDAILEEYNFRPNPEDLHVMQFVEEFTLWPGGYAKDAPWIKGKNCGVWNFSTFKYRAHGWVTDVSDEDQMGHLVGAQYHEMGITSDPAVDPIPGDDYIIYAPGGHMKIVPGNRPVDSPESLCAPPEPLPPE